RPWPSLVHHRQRPVPELLPVLPAVLRLPLDELDDGRPEIDALQLPGGVQPTRADRIDLDKLVADDVDAGVEDAVGQEARADGFGDLEDARGDLGQCGFAAGGHVAAEVALRA